MNSLYTTLFVALLAVSIYALNENENNYLQELIDAGVSQETAQGIVDIAAKHNQDGADPNKSGRQIFEAIIQETNAYIATRPATDKTAFESFVEDKKNEFGTPDADNADDE